MNNSITTLRKIVELFESYAEGKHEDRIGVEDFVLWLNKDLFDHKDTDATNPHTPDVHLTYLISLLSKHNKYYTKKALAESEISNAESYSFLYHLYLAESFRKMELIKIHQLEAPTGIEILKRLLAKKMISEFEDPDDKRAKRVKITKKGKQEIEKLLPSMEEVYNLSGGNLDLNQKVKLISYLSELNEFHNTNRK